MGQASVTEYHIETLADLLDASKATEDLDGLFEDLRTWVDAWAMFTPDTILRWKPVFIWKDDGERGLRAVRIQIEPSEASAK